MTTKPETETELSLPAPIDQLLGSVSCDTDGVEGKVRTSARVFKKMRFDSTSDKKVEVKKEEKVEEPCKVEIKKSLNPMWTAEEKQIFFEALSEYGKDFESIHMFLMNRLKKKGISEDNIKTKHQIRHFYYRTFHSVSSFIKFSETIPKNAQELYALINFGELRKKAGSVPKKSYMKISDLIYTGSISIKTKGKTIRVKTPMCKALRRLNKLDEKYDDLRLPTRVLVELRPKNMESFLKVQSMAQNPRIRMALPLQKRISSLITCIGVRWKTGEALIYDKSIISTNPTTKDCVPDQKQIEETLNVLNPVLRLSPPPNAHIELPLIDISEYFTGQSICLNAYEARKGVKTEVKREELDLSKSPIKTDLNLNSVTEVVDNAVNTILSLKEATKIKEDNCKNFEEEKRKKIDGIKEGWTLINCGCLTIGEIYLMFGSDSKLTLEYCWDEPVKEEDKQVTNNSSLSYSLKKLLSLAKLHNKKLVETKCNCKFKRPIPPPPTAKLRQNYPEKIDIDHENNAMDAVLIQSKIQQFSNDPYFHSQNRMLQLFTQIDAVQRQNSKFRNKRGRRTKQVVVERNLVPNKSDTNHQIVTVNIASQDKNDEEFDELDEAGTSDKLTEDENEDNFRGLLSGTTSPIPSGLAKILKENENQWINAEADYSLSSLLGHLECPSKSNQSTSEDSQLPQDVDSQLNKLLMETSVDFTAKFADLAAQVVDNKK